MKARDYVKIITELAQLIQEGIHIVDENGTSIFYSSKMAELEQVRREDVLGKPFREVFAHIPMSESTLNLALKKRKATYNKEQTYTNKYGKPITTVNSTVPIIIDGNLAGAVEIANDITSIKVMTDTIMELQGKEIQGGSQYDAKIKRYTFADLIGNNREFKRQVEIAKKAANSKASVFMYGETGTGKELFAQSIHYGSSRAGKPFLSQNCSSLPESLLETVLFGVAKSTINGEEGRPGLFEQANGGTLLLDEISALSYEMQSKLLRVIQEEYIRRVGSNQLIPINVRVIATINEPVGELLAKGDLRKDLYYRLNIISLNLPPLRERKDDIDTLAKYLLEKQSIKANKFIPGFETDALRKFYEYDFPGNVRELENCVARAVALAEEDKRISESEVEVNNVEINKNPIHTAFNAAEEGMVDYMERLEQSLIEEALTVRQGNVSQAAEFLGIKRQTLQHKLKKYGI
ncbi:MAG: sigma 54-interacting transcriptional regulator [Anaerovoracaceae bacterium]